jgi:hypothetical protein
MNDYNFVYTPVNQLKGDLPKVDCPISNVKGVKVARDPQKI